MARVEPLSEPAVAWVLGRLRLSDLAEVTAVSPGEFDPAQMARELIASTRFGAQVSTADGAPAVVFGGVRCWPGVWSAWLLATDDWHTCWRIAFRWLHRGLPRLMEAAGAHRVQVLAGRWNEAGATLLSHLDFRAEGVARGFGRRGEDFTLWARTIA